MTNTTNTIRRELPVDRDFIDLYYQLMERHASGEVLSISDFENFFSKAQKSHSNLFESSDLFNEYAESFGYTVNLYKATLNLQGLSQELAEMALVKNPDHYELWSFLLKRKFSENKDIVLSLLKNHLKIREDRKKEFLGLFKVLSDMEILKEDGILGTFTLSAKFSTEFIIESFIDSICEIDSDAMLKKAVKDYLYSHGHKSDLEGAEIVQDMKTKDIIVEFSEGGKIMIPSKSFRKSFLKMMD